MKHVKKLASLLLAMVMVLAMSTAAFAANVTLPTDDLLKNHTFVAYQIFTGDEANGTLSNVKWGNGIESAAFLNDLKSSTDEDLKILDTSKDAEPGTKVNAFAKCTTAADVADVLGKNNSNDALAKAFARIAFDHKKGPGITLSSGDNTLSDGYYLIVDTTDVSGDQDKVQNAALLQVVGDDVTIGVKTDKPTLDKQIKHNETNTWGVVGDNQIGDTVEFRTITTVPNTTYYETYTYTITDTMSAGLTSNVKTAGDLKILVNDDETKQLSTDYYRVDVDSKNSNKFKLTIDIKKAVADGKMKAGDKLYTNYSGVLNENAEIYSNGKEDNKACLIYSNEPNGDGTGKTPEKVVYDWTFKMGINKVDSKGKELTGAKFVLSEKGGLNIADLELNADGVPANTTDLIALIANSDGTYTVAPAGYTGNTTYVIDAGNTTIKGLDDETDYYLYETKAPAGYNLRTTPVKFRIAAEYRTDGSALKENYPTVTVDSGTPTTTLSADVVNQAGSTLPETGGMGTTLFYIIGSLMVAVAAVLLIVKRRMSVER